MSLINDMLRDLEKRNGHKAPPEGVVLSGIGWRPAGSRGAGAPWARYLAAGAVAASLLSAYGVYVSRQPSGGGPSAHSAGAVNRPAAGGERPAGIPAAEPARDPGDSPRAPRQVVAAAKAPPSAAPVPLERLAYQDMGRPGPLAAPSVPAMHASAPAHGSGPAGTAAVPGHASGKRGPERRAEGAGSRGAGGDDGQTGVRHPRPSPVPRHLAPATPEQRVARLHREALALVSQGQPEEARDRLADALAVAPDDVPTRRTLAGLMIKSGQLHAAAALLDEGLRLNPQNPALVKLRARIDVIQGDNRAARRLLEGHPPAMSADPAYYALLAAVYQRLGDYGPAGSLYQRLVAANPDNGVWWLGLGIAREAAGDRDEARRAYAKAQHAGPLPPALRKFLQTKLATPQVGS